MSKNQDQDSSAAQPQPQPQSAGPKQKRNPAPKKGPSRRFFHQIQPTFSVAQPSTRLEFLDNSDPSKDVVVRKKAREWVHRNKEKGLAATKKPREKKREDVEADFHAKKGMEVKRWLQAKEMADPLTDVAAGRPDPFDMFPAVGRRVDHIIEYFLTQCPEEIPCSDDKYAWRPKNSALQPRRENTVLANMAEEYVSWVLWLHATTLIRDGMAGKWASEEMHYYYKLSLKVMQEASQRKVEDYTDGFLCSLACFTACANFSGMFDAAQMHCNAMIRAITLRGGGDLLTGFLQCNLWAQKAIQWCEFGIAAQDRVLPKVPYSPPLPQPLPSSLIEETDRLTTVTLSSIPPISEIFFNIFRMLHQLSISQVNPLRKHKGWPATKKMDPSLIRPLYDVEYTLLQILSRQRTENHGYTDLEVLLSESCQVLLWTGPRGLPAEMKMCNRFVAWLKVALLPLLARAPTAKSERTESPLMSTPSSDEGIDVKHPVKSDESVGGFDKHDNAIIWALYLGTIVSKTQWRPEYTWYKKRFAMHCRRMGIKSKENLKNVLDLFPYTDGYKSLKIDILDIQVEAGRMTIS